VWSINSSFNKPMQTVDGVCCRGASDARHSDYSQSHVISASRAGDHLAAVGCCYAGPGCWRLSSQHTWGAANGKIKAAILNVADAGTQRLNLRWHQSCTCHS
jgi:hypothetical protein